MTLTTENKFMPFADYYASLIAHEPTEYECFAALLREEVGTRKRVETEEQRSFTDVLHVAGVFVGDKKVRLGIGKRAEKAAQEEAHRKVREEAARPRAADGSLIPGYSARISMPPTTRRAMAIRAVEEAVWFPAAEPMPVTPPSRPLVPGYPYSAVQALFEEEAELRRWLCGVEARLRQQMDEECHHDLFIALRLREIEALEKRGRSRLERDQIEVFSSMRNQVFYLAPPEYFRTMVVRRFGATPSAIEERQRELTFPEQEAEARSAVEAEEHAAFVNLFDYLQDAYNVQIFTANHLELVRREEILREEKDDWYPMMLESARATYGLLYEHCPAVFLNMPTARATAPLMHDLVKRFKGTLEARSAEAHRTLHSSSRVPPDEEPKREVAVELMPETEMEVTEDAPAAEKPILTMDSVELEKPASPVRDTRHVTVFSPDASNIKYMAVEEDLDGYDEL